MSDRTRRYTNSHTVSTSDRRHNYRRVSERRSTPHLSRGFLPGGVTASLALNNSDANYGQYCDHQGLMNLNIPRHYNHYTIPETSSDRTESISTITHGNSMRLRDQLPSTASFYPFSSKPGLRKSRPPAVSRCAPPAVPKFGRPANGRGGTPAVPKCAPRRTTCHPPAVERNIDCSREQAPLTMPRYDPTHINGTPPGAPSKVNRPRENAQNNTPRCGRRHKHDPSSVRPAPKRVDLRRLRSPPRPWLPRTTSSRRNRNRNRANPDACSRTRTPSPTRESPTRDCNSRHAKPTRARSRRRCQTSAPPRCAPRRIGGPSKAGSIRRPPAVPSQLSPPESESESETESSESLEYRGTIAAENEDDVGEITSAGESSLAIVQKPRKTKKKDEIEEKSRKLALRIINDYLTLRCANRKCRLAFLDFDGCFVLCCFRCERHFCAWCLMYHHWNEATVAEHIKRCSEAALPGRFHPFDVFEEHQQIRRRNMIINMLRDETERVRVATLHKLSKNLDNLSIYIAPSDLED